MTSSHTELLETEFQYSANWSKSKISELAVRLSLKRAKVYKWLYDRRKRELAASNDQQTV